MVSAGTPQRDPFRAGVPAESLSEPTACCSRLLRLDFVTKATPKAQTGRTVSLRRRSPYRGVVPEARVQETPARPNHPTE